MDKILFYKWVRRFMSLLISIILGKNLRGIEMNCPSCEEHIGWEWVEDEAIEPNEIFKCPECSDSLRYYIDEGTYLGPQHKTVEVID